MRKRLVKRLAFIRFVRLFPVLQCFRHINLTNMLYMNSVRNQAGRGPEYNDDCHNKRRHAEIEETSPIQKSLLLSAPICGKVFSFSREE